MVSDASVVATATPRTKLPHRMLHFGWGTILIGAAAMAATYPGRTHGLGMITEPLLESVGLADPDGRVLYAALNFWATMLGALACLPVGAMFDRYDRRWILAGNLILLGLSVAWMSRVGSWQQLFVGLVLTRGLGQSALSVVSITIVAKAFEPRRLGLAMAFYAILAAPFHLVSIQAVGWALNDAGFDWRTIWCGVGVALIAMSIMALALRNKGPVSPQRLQKSADAAAGATLDQALATPAFWVFSLTISIWGMIYAGVALFNVDVFRELGFNQRLYFNVLSVITLVALASKLIFGWLVGRVRMTRLLCVCLLLTAASLAALPWATQPWHAYLYGVCLSIASGAVALLFLAVWGTLYGPRALGRIQGVAQMLTVFASASGPLVFSWCKRATGTYTTIFHVLAALVLTMAVLAWFTPLPGASQVDVT